jgi:ectoine hydroxylase-related dioxygenase (phytanoyl-CoA dioxygenase family)
MSIEPTDDIKQANHDLTEHGLALYVGGLDPVATADVRERLLRAADLSEAHGVPTRGYPFDPDHHNRRVFNLFNLDSVFVDLIRDQLALNFVRHMIGEDFLISNFSANITAPGSQPMQLHADQGYVLPPWPNTPLACNVAWLLDDFTEANGGTCYVPDSHRIGHGPAPSGNPKTVPISAPAGALLLMDGRLWHQTGANTTKNESRAALFGYYVLRWIRPQINWNAALWPQTVASLDPEFLHLLGYYTGNVEFQISHGELADIRPPSELIQANDNFALGNAQDAKRQ